ncbi:MAG: glutamate-1-semialdehyde-2,1-aminomutase [Deltaproteobacteria bacterium]|nr:MAG: glutamate-1-semialdehyde-2,1-aminomutase [Deltaproteobacteria bacterium]
MTPDTSQTLFDTASTLIPGGVNSPVRACKSVGVPPLFIDKADGAYLYDADGNIYIDYVGSWGPMILGHRHPDVISAITAALAKGTSFGAPTELEIQLAKRVIDCVPSVERVRMVNSGTEATMSAIRLARGYTKRDLIIKFDGCYHGHADLLLVAAGSGVATLNIPGSPGVPAAVTKTTLSLPYNDTDTLARVMAEQGEKIAAVIAEPVAGNMGTVLPEPGFLQAIRELTAAHGALFILDEVMTGFRVALGGAQSVYGIDPDISCFGKIIGGGLPVGAYGGKKEILSHVAPVGPVYQAGTLSGNPLAMAAGIATLDAIRTPGFYDALDKKAAALSDGLVEAAAQAGIPVYGTRAGSMTGLFFAAGPIRNFDAARTSDLNRFSAWYAGMRKRGVYLAPSQFEAGFVSAAHTDADIDATLEAAKETFRELA